MELSKATGILSSLAQETRLDVFRTLVEAGDDGLAAGEIAARLSVPPSSLSHHLKELKIAGLVVCRRDQRRLIYRARYETMRDLLAFLTDRCCGGRPEICDPRWSASPLFEAAARKTRRG